MVDLLADAGDELSRALADEPIEPALHDRILSGCVSAPASAGGFGDDQDALSLAETGAGRSLGGGRDPLQDFLRDRLVGKMADGAAAAYDFLELHWFTPLLSAQSRYRASCQRHHGQDRIDARGRRKGAGIGDEESEPSEPISQSHQNNSDSTVDPAASLCRQRTARGSRRGDEGGVLLPSAGWRSRSITRLPFAPYRSP